MAGFVIINATAPEKSVDGSGRIERGTFYVNGTQYDNATCVDGIVYDSDGRLVGRADG